MVGRAVSLGLVPFLAAAAAADVREAVLGDWAGQYRDLGEQIRQRDHPGPGAPPAVDAATVLDGESLIRGEVHAVCRNTGLGSPC